MGEETPHILIVEDDEDTGFVYGVLLQMEGYRVTHVRTYADGLARALSTSYDLITMDVRLPDGDGVELCKQVRAFNRITPVLFVSAAAYNNDVERGIEAGAQAYLTKPTDPDALIERARYLLGQKSLKVEQREPAALIDLVSSAPVAAALMDEKGTYKAVSPAYAAAGGYNAGDLIGHPVTDIFPDVSGEATTALCSVRETRQPHFISRYPYTAPNQPDRSITYWDAAIWPVDCGRSSADILIVVRQKEQSGDIAYCS
jgi:CheY-like chemotaxis protein